MKFFIWEGETEFLNLHCDCQLPSSCSMAHFTPFEVGQVKAHLHHGLGPGDIAKIIYKPDGKNRYSHTAVANIIAKLGADRNYRGQRKAGSGRERFTTKAQDKLIVQELKDSRGEYKVTVDFLRNKFSWLRNFGNTLIEERLHEAGLWWMRRRNKTIVTERYLPGRIAYCRVVLNMWQATLDLWAYTDGTVFYLDRDPDELEHSQRAALGKMVWRHSDHRDAMFQECLGPSTYKKAQGHLVRVWGMLSEGSLKIHILEQGEAMNAELYEELIDESFEDWLGACKYLVQDFERCLRSPGPLQALKSVGVQLVEKYPRVSQDFNAIENCWRILRDRLSRTLPSNFETREDFIGRLKQAVTWINRHEARQLWHLSRNQKERCRDCLVAEPCGARTKW